MGPLKDWISNPNTSLGYNIGSGATSAAGSLFGNNNQAQNPNLAAIYQSMQSPFETALAAQQRAFDQESALYESQAQLAELEAEATAAQKSREVSNFRENQANAYNASGVLLEGSPMIVLDETRRLGEQEIAAIRLRGQAQADTLRQRGALTQAQGRAAIFGERQKFTNNQTQAQIQSAAKQTKAYGTGLTTALSALLGSPQAASVPRSKPASKPAAASTSNSPTGSLRGFLPQPGFNATKMNKMYGGGNP